MLVRYEWDPAKDESNRRKHRISFETAVRAFSDPYAILEQDRTVDFEERWQIIGRINHHLMLLVAHTYQADDAGEAIRIISARRTKRHEESRYDNENDSIYGRPQ